LLSFNTSFFFQAIDCCGSDLKDEEEPTWKSASPWFRSIRGASLGTMRRFAKAKIQILHCTLAGRVSYLLNVPTQPQRESFGDW